MSKYVTTVHDDDYAMFELMVAGAIHSNKEPVFTTDAANLFSIYIEGLVDSYRQHYRCNTCERFVERYGGLVTIDERGITKPLLWSTPVPHFFSESVFEMCDAVKRAKVTGVFIDRKEVWGVPKTGEWSHLSGKPSVKVATSPLKTDGQVMAEKADDFKILKRGLSEYPVEVVRQAVRVLEADALDRGEKALEQAKWLLELHNRLGAVRGQARDNIVWRAVATAPAGWCHVRSTMINTLLDDIHSGLSFEEISRRWAQKMHPLQYQRPTAPPSDALISQANEVMDRLRASSSLRRRYARLEEVAAYWRPSPVKPWNEGGGRDVFKIGTFDHLRGKSEQQKMLALPPVTMTWAVFEKDVLSRACELSLRVPYQGPFFGLVTAVDPNSEPILQWDTDPRNPVSWFFYHNGSSASRWNLKSGQWAKVTAVCKRPPYWFYPDKFKGHGESAFLVLENCYNTEPTPGGAFFPENLRSEFHGIRKVIEAHSNSYTIEDAPLGTANGYSIDAGKSVPTRLMVRLADGDDREYVIDRWY